MQRQRSVRIVLLLSLGMLGASSLPPDTFAAEAGIKIGLVDVQRVIAQSQQGKDARGKIEAEARERQKEIDAQEGEIKKMEADLQKQTSLLTPAARRDREEALQKRIRDLRRITEDINRDLAKKEGELANQVLREIAEVVRAYGEEKGYTLIIERSQGGVLYGSKGVDVSDEIIQRLDGRKK